MKRPRTFSSKFRRKHYRVRFVEELPDDRDGDCDPPSKHRPEIRIRLGIDRRKTLTALIHEGLHACFWDIDDEAITEASEQIADMIDKSAIFPRDEKK